MNPAISTSSVRSLLECYIRAKDQNQPDLIFDCFAADAELTFDIATDAIDFPRSVTGAAAIAKTLVADFGERFDRCRTYYVCAAPEVDADGICTMPWLVAMRQKDNGSLRFGRGEYRWRIARMGDGSDRIVGLHIAIERMDTIDDPGSVRLRSLQDTLSYPWLTPAELLSHGALQIPPITPAKTALIVMHYQTDILGLFPSVAPDLIAKTRTLCDAARSKGVCVYFANLRFSPGYPEVSPLNKNGQGIKRLGLFVEDRTAPELGQTADEPLIVAHRASVFFDTDLEARLSARGVDSLIMVGIASTGVVLSSVAYASDADFRLYTVKDCCYDPDQVVHEHLFSTAFDSRTTVLSLANALLLLA